jgi:hypothetical protein
MEFTLEELYDFANVSAPGGNHYTIDETNRVWNSEKGMKLSSFVDSNSFYQHFIMVHIYGAMAQRYSGVFDTRELYILEGNSRLKEFYEFLEVCTFPYGYKFRTVRENSGYKLLIQKDNENLENSNARIGIEYYNDIPDKVHRPPYTIKPDKVMTYLSVSLSEFQRLKRNEELQYKSLEKLRLFQLEMEKKNIDKFVEKIKSYSIETLREIMYEINYENDEYEIDCEDYDKNMLIDTIYHELINSYYEWSRKFLLKF